MAKGIDPTHPTLTKLMFKIHKIHMQPHRGRPENLPHAPSKPTALFSGKKPDAVRKKITI